VRLIKKAMKTPVDPDLLRLALSEFAKLDHRDRNDFEGRAFATFRLLEKNKTVKQQDRPWLPLAIEWRLSALAKLSERIEMKAFTIGPDKSGATWLSDDVLQVAAREPLIQKDRYTVEFSADSFLANLLRRAKPAGNA